MLDVTRLVENSLPLGSQQRKRILCGSAAALALLIAATYLWSWAMSDRPWSAAKLADMARHGDSSDARQRAAVKLVSGAAEALARLRELAVDCDDPAVRATCLQGIGAQRDFDSIDLLVDALADSSPLVRARAKHALGRLWNREIFFPVDGSDAERSRALAGVRTMWGNLQRWGVVESLRKGELLSYYYDQATGGFYEGPAGDAFSSDHPSSHTGPIQANVYCCGEVGPFEDRFVGFLSVSGAELQRRGQLPPGSDPDEEAIYVALPGSEDWRAIDSREGEAIVETVLRRCPEGKRPVRCFPHR